MIVDISTVDWTKKSQANCRSPKTLLVTLPPLAQLEGVELDLDIDLNRLDQLNLVVEVPDPNLRQAIRETLSLPDGAPLTQLEMLRLTEL